MTWEQALAELLTLEARAQAERTQADLAQLTAHQAEQAGQSLIDLVVIDEAPGLGGLTVLTLRKRNRSLALPRVRIQAGDPVRVQTPTGPQGLRGVVVQKNAEHLKVAIGDEAAELDLDATYRIDRSADEITTDRLLRTLRRLEGAQKNRLAELKQIGAGERALGVGTEPEPSPTPNLDPTQAAAVQFALHAPDWALIHGPPGTGKTTAVVELIVQAAARGERILVTAPSNLAVDNLLERLLARGLLPVRLGHPARVLPQVEGRVLSVLVEESEEVRIARNLVKEALQLRRKAQKWTRAKPAPGEKAAMEREARERFADARRLEAMAVERILDQAQIVGATCTFDDSQLKGRRFDRVVVDEACQATEPATWAPILHGERVVLAGDHLQLPPTVISPEAAARGLSVSLFERLHARHGAAISRRLGVQYRMHQQIMGYSSLALYDGGIVAAPAVQDHLLVDLPGIARAPLTETALLFVDTAGAGHQERVEADGESRANPEEAAVVANLGRQLLELGLSPPQLGVITPYAAQANLLRELLPEAVEVDTVDGFQGREKEAILISCVRSNDQGQIGFLSDVRRMNVALTRARRKLVVVGDSATLSGHPFYRDLLEWFEAAGAYTTVWELPT